MTKLEVFTEIFADIAKFIADLFAKIKEFAAGFDKHYDFETDAAE